MENVKTDTIVSKEEFAEYVEIQELGMFNMLDSRAREMTSLSRIQWTHILKNYQFLSEIYKTNK